MGVVFVSDNNFSRKPDNIIVMRAGGTTYEVREFFSGKQTIEDIITQRILHEIASNPPISEPEKPINA